MNKLTLLILLSLSACAHHNYRVVSPNDPDYDTIQSAQSEPSGPPVWKRVLGGIGTVLQGAGQAQMNHDGGNITPPQMIQPTNCTSQRFGNSVYTNCY